MPIPCCRIEFCSSNPVVVCHAANGTIICESGLIFWRGPVVSKTGGATCAPLNPELSFIVRIVSPVQNDSTRNNGHCESRRRSWDGRNTHNFCFPLFCIFSGCAWKFEHRKELMAIGVASVIIL